MWYAITSKPLAAALTAVLMANVTTAGAGFQGEPVHSMVPAATVMLSSPEMPADAVPPKAKFSGRDFPASFYKAVFLPQQYRMSEHAALAYLARVLHIQLHFSGPDYALVGGHLPYNRPVPAIQLLLRIGNIPWINGSFVLMGNRILEVHNAPLPGSSA